ncbi:MAG: hypothetical protein IJD39_08165 [Clostridia bacterium]|nr:hypothetical protein [Clostridia bacterium]
MYKEDQEFFIRKIRDQYTEKENTPLDQLRAMDAQVKRPALMFGWIFGILSALLMGSGMSLVMTDLASVIGLGDGMTPGIVIGVIGLIMTCINYPIYRRILSSRKKQFKTQILQFSSRMLQNP